MLSLFLIFFSVKTNKELVNRMQESEKIESILNTKNEELTVDIINRDILIKNLEIEVQNKEVLADAYMDNADYFKAKYKALIKNGYIIPETAEDSLKVCLMASESLFSENSNLRSAVKVKDSVIAIQRVVNSNLRLNITTLNSQLTNERAISNMWKVNYEKAKELSKKDKRKSLVKGIGIGGAGVALIIAFLVL